MKDKVRSANAASYTLNVALLLVSYVYREKLNVFVILVLILNLNLL